MDLFALPFASLYPVITPEDFGIAEPDTVSVANISEKLVCCMWFEPRWRPERLETLDGRQLVVHSPGQWNRQAGPDFLQAVLEFGHGERCRGDVEVHRLSSGWTAHQHHLDPRYNGVVLHVVLRNDRSTYEVARADGLTIPQVALEPLLSRPLAVYRDEIPLEDYPNKHAPRIGQCYITLQALPLDTVQQFLERAGDTRLQTRLRHWSQRAALVGPDQTMYEAVFRYLGSSGYSQPFLDMAHRLSWRESRDILSAYPVSEQPIVAEALLFGISGLLYRARDASHNADDETRIYWASLHRVWARLPEGVRCLANQQINWRHPHVRPANTLERRLAGMAQLLSQFGDESLYQTALSRCLVLPGLAQESRAQLLYRALMDMLQTPVHPYWSTHSHFGSRPGRTQQRLIGSQRALSIVVDAMLPVLLCEAGEQGHTELQQLLLTAYRMAPRLSDNAILRHMSRRLLGDDSRLLALVTRARHQQGMLQIFEDYCSRDEGECQGCDFPQP